VRVIAAPLADDATDRTLIDRSGRRFIGTDDVRTTAT